MLRNVNSKKELISIMFVAIKVFQVYINTIFRMKRFIGIDII